MEDLESFLNNNMMSHLVQHMVDQELTLEILMQANDGELAQIAPKIADKIKLRTALDKRRRSLLQPDSDSEAVQVSLPVRETTTLYVKRTSDKEPNIIEQIEQSLPDGPSELDPAPVAAELAPAPVDPEVQFTFPGTKDGATEEWSLTLNSSDIDLFNSFEIKSVTNETGKSLRQLLSSVAIGKVLLAKAEKGEKLNSRDRALLVKLIVETELNALDTTNKSIRKDVWQLWAKEVVKLFKDENADVFYVPYHVIDGRVIQASGLFHNRLITHRRYLNSNQKKKRSSSSDSSDSGAGSSKSDDNSRKRVRPLPENFDCTNSSTTESNIEWLKSSSYPEEMLIEKWKSCLEYRQNLMAKI